MFEGQSLLLELSSQVYCVQCVCPSLLNAQELGAFKVEIQMISRYQLQPAYFLRVQVFLVTALLPDFNKEFAQQKGCLAEVFSFSDMRMYIQNMAFILIVHRYSVILLCK